MKTSRCCKRKSQALDDGNMPHAPRLADLYHKGLNNFADKETMKTSSFEDTLEFGNVMHLKKMLTKYAAKLENIHYIPQNQNIELN